MTDKLSDERLRAIIEGAQSYIGANGFDPDPEEIIALASELLALRPAVGEAHTDDEAVDRFAAAMKEKLAKKRADGRGGWENKDECTAEFLSELLRGHVGKGDPIDVANLAMMLHQRGERIASIPSHEKLIERLSDLTERLVSTANLLSEIQKVPIPRISPAAIGNMEASVREAVDALSELLALRPAVGDGEPVAWRWKWTADEPWILSGHLPTQATFVEPIYASPPTVETAPVADGRGSGMAALRERYAARRGSGMAALTVDEYKAHVGVGVKGRTGATAEQDTIVMVPGGVTNDLVIGGMQDTIEAAHRARSVDVIVRKDGVEQRFQADWIKYLVAASPIQGMEPGGESRDDRQKRVAEWCAAAFGVEHQASVPQRGLRMLEEAIEAYQALDGSPVAAHRLIDYIFAKEPGKLFQELGGLGITVLALAAAAGLSADDAEKAELDRVLSKPLEWFHARNKAKNDAGFDATAYPAAAIRKGGKP